MDQDRRASSGSDRRTPGSPPGLWQAAVVSALSALACGYWAFGQAAIRDDPNGAANVSRLAEVSPAEIDGALDTLDGPRDQLAQFKRQEACGHRLAWVSIMRVAGQPPGKIRLQSGRYITLAFELKDTPTRVAIPFPNSYAAGHGTVSVIGTSADAVIALTPPWTVSAKDGTAARDVTWTPVGRCPTTAN